MLTGLGRLVLVVSMLGVSITMFLYLGYQSRGFKANVQNYIESQQDYPTFR